jgi:uncharacterized protein YjbI with pentapeptide repeats
LRSVHFKNCTFDGTVTFANVSARNLSFTNNDVQNATFRHLTAESANYSGTVFRGSVDLARTSFNELSLRRVRLEGDIVCHEVVADKIIYLNDAVFLAPNKLGALISGVVTLSGTTFHQRAHIEVSAFRLSMQGVQFLGGGIVRARRADVYLDEAAFDRPFVVAGGLTHTDKWSKRARDLDRNLTTQAPAWRHGSDHRPRIVGLRRADLVNLEVENVDLSAARFAGAYHIESLRIGGECEFAQPPRRWHSKRKVLAEEIMCREGFESWPDASALHDKRSSWHSPKNEPLGKDHYVARGPTARQLVDIYRALRKGREDAGDEPGAEDFYYGEMEMRRRSAGASVAERAILNLYWLISGYGLRAWRTFVALIALLAVSTACFYTFGIEYEPRVTVEMNLDGSTAANAGVPTLDVREAAASTQRERTWDALSVSVGSVTSLLASGQRATLTRDGEAVQLVVRLAGPLLLALALLAMRNRVKR